MGTVCSWPRATVVVRLWRVRVSERVTVSGAPLTISCALNTVGVRRPPARVRRGLTRSALSAGLALAGGSTPWTGGAGGGSGPDKLSVFVAYAAGTSILLIRPSQVQLIERALELVEVGGEAYGKLNAALGQSAGMMGQLPLAREAFACAR